MRAVACSWAIGFRVMCMQPGFSVISLFVCGRSTLPTLLLTCLQESWVVLQRSRQLMGVGGGVGVGGRWLWELLDPSRLRGWRLGVEQPAAVAACAWLSTKSSLAQQGVTRWPQGGWGGCLPGRNRGAKQLATQPARDPVWQSGAWMLLPCPGCTRSLPTQLFPRPTKSAAHRTVTSTQGAKFPSAQIGVT